MTVSPVLDLDVSLRRAVEAPVAPRQPGSRVDLAEFILTRGEDLRQWMMVQIDVANFRFMNALFGRAFGDLLLEAIGALLVRDQRFVWFRTNGDVWVGIGEARPTQSAVEQIERLRRELARGVKIALKRDVRLDLSIGVAFGAKLDDLCFHVEVACRQAKASGRAQVVVGHKERKIEQSPVIRALLGGGRLSDVVQLHHQRIAHRDGTEHYEVLSRCEGLSIGGVICAIERMGMARDFDTAVLRMALEEIPDSAPTHAINLSAATLTDQDAILECIELLQGRSNLAVEITETAVIRDGAKAAHAIELLRQANVDVYLDDYGDGATSLTMLSLPFSFLKLGAELSSRDCPGDILGAVVELARARAMPVVAEMVETEPQFQRLFDAGVFGFQGWLVHRPERITAKSLGLELEGSTTAAG